MGDFKAMYLPVKFTATKKFLATKIALEGKNKYTDVLECILKDKQTMMDLFGKKTNKFHVEIFL